MVWRRTTSSVCWFASRSVDVWESILSWGFAEQDLLQEQFYAMLAQRLPQLHCDYLQTAHLPATGDSKTSPLALLAATCSSIGRNENEKPKGAVFTVVPAAPLTLTPKGDEQVKSSFKPYKAESKSAVMRSSPSVIAPKSSPTSSRSNPNPMFLESLPPHLPPLDSESLRRFASNFLDTRESAVFPPNVKCHASSLPPLLAGRPLPAGLPPPALQVCHDCECKNCASSLTRSHLDSIPTLRRSSPSTSCPCSMCLQNREQAKGHYQAPTVYSTFKALPPPIVCRDPSCTNCARFAHGTLQNFLHPALIHQCTYESSPSIPPSQGTSEYAKHVAAGMGFVCNWMAEGKHCGKNFSSSEELFRHLKSHTSSQQQKQNCGSHLPVQVPGSPSACSIFACPCRSIEGKSRSGLAGLPYGSGTRYSPYSRGLPSMPGGAVTFQGHLYPPHGVFHY